LPSAEKKALDKEALCRVSKIKHSTKNFFAECFLLPRVFCLTLGKELFCRVPEKTLGKTFGTRQNIWHSAKSRIPVVQGLSAHYEPIFRHSDIVNHSQTCAMCGLGHPQALWVITALQLPLNRLYVADHQEQQPLDSYLTMTSLI
jgi:hypothetical protein